MLQIKNKLQVIRFYLINPINKLIGSVNPLLKFVLILLFVSLFYEYPSIVMKRPQSVHKWRQTDCTSVASLYYQTGFHFFKPQTYNLTSDNNTTGYNATSEIPVIYYFVAILYKIFGFHEFIYRLLNTLLFLTALFYLYKTLMLWLKSHFWSAAFTILLFTSPVLVYYGNNFLTDTSAFSFALIAIFFFSKFYFGGRQQNYLLSMLFFLLAGSCKITSLISLVAIIGAFIIELIGLVKLKGDKKLFQKPILQSIPFIIIGLIVGSWTLYARHFNHLHYTDYFSTGTLPIWDLNNQEINQVIKNIKELWLGQYFHITALIVFGISLVLNIIFWKRSNIFLRTILIFIFLGVILYAILWFQTFQHHDYYTINLYILVIFSFLSIGWALQKSLSKYFNNILIKVFFIILILFNINYAKNQIHDRYYGWWNDHNDFQDYDNITPYLRSIGIAPLDTVICLPDITHSTLYLMNQRGWTACYSNNYDSASIQNSIKHGAKYLILNGNVVLGRSYIRSFINHPIGNFGMVRIFKLDKNDRINSNNQINNKNIKIEKIFCGAEKLTSDGKSFIADSSNELLQYGETQSAEKSFSGKYSAKLTKEHPYGMTIHLKNVHPGQYFKAEVYRYSEHKNGQLIVSCNNPKEYYSTAPIDKINIGNGWELLTTEVYVNFTPSDGEIAFYLYNDGLTPVYFDNLQITRLY